MRFLAWKRLIGSGDDHAEDVVGEGTGRRESSKEGLGEDLRTQCRASFQDFRQSMESVDLK